MLPETTKLARVHHLRWVTALASSIFNFVRLVAAGFRPTVFEGLPQSIADCVELRQPKEMPRFLTETGTVLLA
ncbi:hypothetical protein RB25_25800 [Herbaspirillum rubrisubalbicans]|jgi:hypothetical protein|uniref:Uncharacterized protein n=2 Tax=Herbaspirillum rubrisubalbicans TaxID=80842 RepID=A0AAD0U537_9BURK|nr:hypothetical protein RC54_00580 [Herbaspirillum rubrisubalbicans]NQE51843.1 hypothetical protein [Herbaspirillum rubrisubalbicans]QJP98809.1 hypothetical protein C798_00775 [Herbaspirillum rubrisubalbicans Os34]RAM61317.1 hypothetical protein RB24_25785 [Herbaspirillum rubrisubalbicans]RAN42530.1 hypothetical protein RB25_25800 [Herbaspirillum rubrisubalbicans]